MSDTVVQLEVVIAALQHMPWNWQQRRLYRTEAELNDNISVMLSTHWSWSQCA